MHIGLTVSLKLIVAKSNQHDIVKSRKYCRKFRPKHEG